MLRLLEVTGIAELLYNWNAVFTLLLGLAIDIVLWFSKKKKRINIVLIACVSIIALCLTALIVLLRSQYTYVPENLWENMPFSEAKARIIDCGLRCSDENIQWDSIALEKVSEGMNPSNISFRVEGIDPIPGTFVEKNSEVTLIVTWKPYVFSDGELKRSETVEHTQVVINNSYETHTEGNEIHENPYPNFDPIFCQPFNANDFTLIVEEQAVKIVTDAGEEWALGSIPDSPTTMQVNLINFDSGLIVDSKNAYIGDTVHFAQIPDGIYYFEVLSEGYRTGISNAPFVLKYDELKEKDNLSWITYLEKVDISYGQKYRVQMVSRGKMIAPNTETTISVIRGNRTGSSYPVYINENGLLTLWMGINGMDYYFVADFYVADGYTLIVYDHNNQFLEASSIINGICTLEY